MRTVLPGFRSLAVSAMKMDAAHDDKISPDLCGFTGERERVARNIGNSVKDLRSLIIMDEHDRLASQLEFQYRCDIWRMDRPFDFRDDLMQLLIDVSGFARDFRRKNRHLHGSILVITIRRHVVVPQLCSF